MTADVANLNMKLCTLIIEPSSCVTVQQRVQRLVA